MNRPPLDFEEEKFTSCQPGWSGCTDLPRPVTIRTAPTSIHSAVHSAVHSASSSAASSAIRAAIAERIEVGAVRTVTGRGRSVQPDQPGWQLACLYQQALP
ncbi:hypothetical protein CROQUDRAFT_90275 [Cronartium quercuum f. sp. fusiforme G11]|uniref:Uncharacterized protein n=1 Tax=Cronartium quercuum f. sp. fusiforme G11 TaxID=708437 RepID=A0A9P6NQN4_9BASI|nr:hypothetical protein CROQUDRAFT_90275 [Cronartium quercuum f. sp. fusiforme G11]